MQIAGLKVVDATRPLPVKITDADIKKGNTKDPASCAAALACLRKPACTEARVHIGRTYLKQGNKWVRYQTPRSLRSEIIAFDRGGSFAPGDFVLKPLPSGSRLGHYTHVSKNKNNKRPRVAKKKSYHTVTGIREHGANR